MISIFPNLNLKPVSFHASFSHGVAISFAEPGNLNMFLSNASGYHHIGTHYTQHGDFSTGTAAIYKDTNGTLLTRSDLTSNQSNAITIVATTPFTDQYHMTIAPYSNNFAAPVISNSVHRLLYSTPVWLSRTNDPIPYTPKGKSGKTEWHCTYITLFHSHPLIIDSTKLSLNEYNEITPAGASNPFAQHGNGTFWVTEVEMRASDGLHRSTAIHVDQVSTGSISGWRYPSALNESVRSYPYTSNPSQVYTLERPYTYKQANFAGNGDIAVPTSGPTITYIFQDHVRVYGHTHWMFGIGHPHMPALTNASGANGVLINKCPIYASSTPLAVGGNIQNRTVPAPSGWWATGSGSSYTYWNARTWTWSYYKTDYGTLI